MGWQKDENGEFGELTTYDYGFRIYNPGIGKFLCVDPMSGSFPWYTPYQFAGNTPIRSIDLDGLEIYFIEHNEEFGWTRLLGKVDEINVSTVTTLSFLVGSNAFNINQKINYKRDLGITWTFIYHDCAWRLVPENLLNQSINNFTDEQWNSFPTLSSLDQYVSDIRTIAGKSETVINFAQLAKSLGKTARALKELSKKEIKQVGGQYAKFNNQYDEVGEILTNKNHLPTVNSYKLAGFKISKYLGSAHIMSALDHKNFISTGSSNLVRAFRDAEAKLLKNGKFLESFDLNFNAIKKQFGNKYNESIKQAREYFIKKIIPKLKEQYKKKVNNA